MTSDPFVLRAIRDFGSRHPDFLEAHDGRLSSILDSIRDLPSPLKEERLVEMVVGLDADAPPALATAAPHPSEAPPAKQAP